MTESVIFKTRDDARVEAKPDAAIPPDRPRRRPLGLRPVPDDNGEASRASNPAPEFDQSLHPIVASALAGVSPAGRQAPATVEDTFETLDIALKATFDGDNTLHSHIVALRNQVRDLKGELIEARHEVRELKLIQESLRISARGESGRDGARGVPGRDGQQGPIGPAGPIGPPGKDAPAIVAWATDDANFVAWPVFSNGVKATAGLHLRGMFEVYDGASDEADAAEQAACAAAR